MRFLFLALFLSYSALGVNTNSAFESVFNKLSGIPAAATWSLGTVLREAHTTQVCVYNYATQGGAVGTIALTNVDLITPCVLPGKAVIVNGLVDVSTTLTSDGSATVALQTAGGSANLKTAAAYGGYATSARLQLIPDWATVADSVKLGSSSSYAVQAVVAASALTAGRFRVFLQYVQGE